MSKFDINKIRSDFPIFYNNKSLVYLDSSATTQKPKQIIDAVSDFYSNYNANVHRGIYELSMKATEAYHSARQKVADFIAKYAWPIVIITIVITILAGSQLNKLTIEDDITKYMPADF